MKLAQDALPVKLAKIAIDLGNLLIELPEEALRQTSNDIESLEFALATGLAKVEYHIDALLLGIIDEATSIDDGDIAVKALGIVVGTKAACLELIEEMFGIHKIFGTPHGDDVNAPYHFA
jgi:hypothetical protein